MKLRTMKMILALGVVLLGLNACQTPGCTDPLACNYDPNATQNNGTCDYSCLGGQCINGVITINGSITADQTWTNACIYRLAGMVVVEPGVTLTIEPGAIIKGDPGQGQAASTLVIKKGAKLDAVGTANAPIIFTTMDDNIQLGQLTGTNLGENDYGLWGGVIIMGDAPVSVSGTDTYGVPDGLNLPGATYGGANPTDDSGSLSYVSIRHGGALIGAGNEINGLTLAGVGSGTQISNIEIVATLDDGIELFGGTVDVTNLVVGFQGDDALDIDQNYSGTVNNFFIHKGLNSDEGMEVDGPEGATYTNGMFTVTNGTIVATPGANLTSDFKSSAQGTVSNVDFAGDIKISVAYTNQCLDPAPDAHMNLTNSPATLSFNGVVRTAVTVYTRSDDGGNPQPVTCTVVAADQASAESAIPNGTATGANTTVFDNWTWMSVHGHL